MIRPEELIVDNFAGGGGASTAIEEALGRPIDIAINHDREALAMHRVNHPHTRHLCEDVWDVDPVAVCAGRPVGLAWFSPDCKHFSKAKGGKPVAKNIRGLAWVALKWAEQVRPRIIFLENIEEFKTWGPLDEDNRPCPIRKGETFRRWLARFRALGYREHMQEIRACDFGAPTIRKRLFIVLRCDGIDPAAFWPQATHGAGFAPYRAAAECIDWSIPCPSIFLTREEGRAIGVNRPLAEATMRRIARGVDRYVIKPAKPFIVNMAHGGKIEDVEAPVSTIATEKGGCRALATPFLASLTHHGEGRAESLEEPMRTVTGAHRGEKALIAPTLIQTGYGERDGQLPRAPGLDKPLGTVVAGACKHTVVAAHLSRQFGASTGSAADAPVGTVTAGGGGKTSLVAAHLSRYYGTKREGDERAGSLEQPLPTQPTENRHALVAAFLAQYNGGMVGHPAEEPLSTVTQRGTNQALVASSLLKLRGTNIGSATDEPLHTISSGGTHHAEVRAFLQKYYSSGGGESLDESLHTIPTKDRFGLLMVEGEPHAIVDIGMRMLMPRELFRAQGFPDSYIIAYGIDEHGRKIPLSKTAQVRLCGNSVSPPPAKALILAQMAAQEKGAAA